MKLNKDSITIEWEIADVRQQLEAREKGEKMSDRECMEVLGLALRKHDANIGINWDVLDYWINIVLENRTK